MGYVVKSPLQYKNLETYIVDKIVRSASLSG